MRAELTLSKGVFGKSYYLIIDDKYYLRIKKKRFYDLAKFLKIKVD